MSRRRLTLPVEILNREFDGKLLLACFAAERGFSVIIGFKRELHLRMASLPRSLYLGINMSKRAVQMYDMLRKLGHTIACFDEEALVYLTPETYLRRRVAPNAFARTDALFAWGPDNARMWREAPEYDGTPIHQTGNPRIDMMRPELRSFWSAEVERLQGRFGRFIMINSNFGKLNHFRAGKGEQQNTLKATAEGTPSINESDTTLATHRHALLQHFLPMVSELARDHPDTTVVIRPHPGEDPEMWRQAGAGCPNVQVVHEGPVTPWLLAAGVIIHNGCTTGVEAYQLDNVAIAYRPVTTESVELFLPNNLSRQVSNLETLRDAVSAALARETNDDPGAVAARRELVERYFAPTDGPLATERAVAVLEELDDAPETGKLPPLSTYFVGKSQAMHRRFKRQYKALLRGARSPIRASRFEFHRHIFPETTVSDVEDRIARFRLALDRFSGVSVRRLSKNVFEVTSTRDAAS